MMMITRMAGILDEEGRCNASNHHNKAAKSAPHVPGPGLRRPAPKKVAIRVAQPGAVEVLAAGSVWLFVIVVGGTEIFGVRIVHWRRDNVPSAGPLAQIDYTAAVAAERELRIGGQHDFPAGGTT